MRIKIEELWLFQFHNYNIIDYNLALRVQINKNGIKSPEKIERRDKIYIFSIDIEFPVLQAAFIFDILNNDIVHRNTGMDLGVIW